MSTSLNQKEEYKWSFLYKARQIWINFFLFHKK